MKALKSKNEISEKNPRTAIEGGTEEARNKYDSEYGLWTYGQTAEIENLGMNTVLRLARESGALIKIGRISRVDPPTFHNYILNNYRVTEED